MARNSRLKVRSKNSASISSTEASYMRWVKEQPCVVCNAPGPSDAHHISQGRHFSVLPLCKDCHQGDHNGIHGRKHTWLVMRMDELKALNETIRRFVIAFMR